MNNLKKFTACILALLLCFGAVVPAFATETGENTPGSEPQESQPQESQPQESQPQESEPPEDPEEDSDFGVDFTEVSQTVYVVANINVRMGPGIQYNSIGNLAYGNVVTRIGIGENGWSMILFNGQTAYVFSVYLSTVKPEGLRTPIDDSALLRQVAIANALERSAYTRTSWDVLTAALLNANQALNGDSQQAADEAVKQLQDAIAALVPMDYSLLEEALAELDRLAKTDENTDLWNRLMEAVYDGKSLLGSGNQVAVDEACSRIHDLIDQVRSSIQNQQTPEIVVQEVPVEVPPQDDFCNIPMHRVWPVLFFISLALNGALAAVIIIYIYKKQKNQQDDTPLVDYDIFDDTF